MNNFYKKIILLIVVFSVLSISCGIYYLNSVLLPTTVKTVMIDEVEAFTQKKFYLSSLKFSIFKGIVMTGPVLYGDGKIVFTAKEISFSFLPMLFFKKEILVPSMKIESPKILIERKADSSVNILDMVHSKYVSKSDFKVILNKVMLKNTEINFKDYTMTPVFSGALNRVNAYLYLSLPDKIKFDLSVEADKASSLSLDSSGEYIMPSKELKLKAAGKNISLKEFERYYEKSGISFPDGKIDCVADIKFKDGTADAYIEANGRGVSILKDKISAKCDAGLKANVVYNTSDGNIATSGYFDIKKMDIYGIEVAGGVKNMKGVVKFTNMTLSSEDLKADIFGVPVKMNITLDNAERKIFDINISSGLKLSTLQSILKDRFDIVLPADIGGGGKIVINIRNNLAEKDKPPRIDGTLRFDNAIMSVDKGRHLIESVNGEAYFTPNRITWSDLALRYKNKDYRTSGAITNFQAPGITMEISSDGLELDMIFAVKGSTVALSKFSGQYLNSKFSLSGQADIADTSRVKADINGEINTSTDDLETVFSESREKFEKLKLKSDKLRADFRLKGVLGDLKSSSIDAKIFSDSISIYDLKPTDIVIDYIQRDGVADIRSAHSFLYGGTIDATGRLDFSSEKMKYSINADIQGVKIERLKSDTVFKDKDLAGVIKANAYLSGSYGDLSNMKGSGKIIIINGKLWQLDLLKGIGVLLFTSDFGNIIFKEGYCNFAISDRSFFTDDLALWSDLVNMRGAIKMGFDNSVTGSLKAELREEAMWGGTKKNIVEAIGKYSIIDVKGTLKDPKYTVKPDMSNVVDNIANIFSQ